MEPIGTLIRIVSFDLCRKILAIVLSEPKWQPKLLCIVLQEWKFERTQDENPNTHENLVERKNAFQLS